MPIHEFECESCHNCFEKLVFRGDEEPVACPVCKGTDVRKLLSCASFIGASGAGACSSTSPKGFS